MLFDIAACKCLILVNCECNKTPDLCQCQITINCLCEKPNKIPAIELRFIFVSRVHGMGKIGGIDVCETKKLNKSLERKSRDIHLSTISNPSTSSQHLNVNIVETEEDDKILSNNDDSDNDEEFRVQTKKPSQWQMRVKLTATAIVSDRYGVSDRATAAIASSILHDVGIITDSDSSHVVDKCKIRRTKHNVRSNLSNEADDLPLKGLYLDGRKDDTLVVELVHSKKFRRTKKEEHYSLIQEPGSSYIGHVTPTSGSSGDIVTSIISYLSSRVISLEELVIIGCDGTNVNTGYKAGLIHRIEVHLGKPLQWAVCLLHFNELPFRHLFQYIDGKSKGPKSYKGPIGEKLLGCEKRPVVAFKRINCEIPEVDRNVLNKDQQYLFDISITIQSGNCKEDFAVRDPGPLSHSRWLTTANRTLRLYLSEDKPTDELEQLVLFILKCYMPMWFSIKTARNFTDGPKLVCKMIQTSRYLTEELRNIVDPVIERNGFFAHPEHLMLAMTEDKRNHIRELGLRRILKARQKDASRKQIRTYLPPKLNFKAEEYTELIDWMNCELSSPPLLKATTDDEIKFYIQSAEVPNWNASFNKFPVHTQAVERCVKLVTEAAAKVAGAEARDGFIRATILSRKAMPDFAHKALFKVPEY